MGCMIQRKLKAARIEAAQRAKRDAIRGMCTITEMDILSEIKMYRLRCR